MNITYKILESSPTNLKELLKQNSELVALVPESNPCISIVAFDEGEPIGVIFAYERNEKELYISYILVTVEYQGKGIGTKLIKKIEKLAKEKSIKTLSLVAGECNLRAIALYTKRGFVKSSGNCIALWYKQLVD